MDVVDGVDFCVACVKVFHWVVNDEFEIRADGWCVFVVW